jgi:hypothetical protein
MNSQIASLLDNQIARIQDGLAGHTTHPKTSEEWAAWIDEFNSGQRQFAQAMEDAAAARKAALPGQLAALRAKLPICPTGFTPSARSSKRCATCRVGQAAHA